MLQAHRAIAAGIVALTLTSGLAFTVVAVAVAPVRAQAAQPEQAARPNQPAAAPQYGPASGRLVLVGGGPLAGSGVMERFIELAGGAGKRFVVVPTAAGTVDADGAPVVFDEARVLAPWRALGVRDVTLLHTHDKRVADTAAFAAPVREADAVWFDGGRQWRLVDVYAGTQTLAAFRDVLARGGVIGGSSAGATIQGQYLVRGATAGSDIVMTDEPHHQQGFAFLRRSAVDQHVDTRNRWNDLLPVMRAFPDLLGLGLSERTAIVVEGDRFEVIGVGRVAVHDPTQASDNGAAPAAAAAASVGPTPYLVLEAGAVYDMQARRVVPSSSER